MPLELYSAKPGVCLLFFLWQAKTNQNARTKLTLCYVRFIVSAGSLCSETFKKNNIWELQCLPSSDYVLPMGVAGNWYLLNFCLDHFATQAKKFLEELRWSSQMETMLQRFVHGQAWANLRIQFVIHLSILKRTEHEQICQNAWIKQQWLVKILRSFSSHWALHF